MEDAQNLQRQLDDNRLEHNTFMQKLDKIWDKVIEMNSKIDQMPQNLSDKFDEKYASKNIEKAVYAIVGAFILAFIYGLVSWILKIKI